MFPIVFHSTITGRIDLIADGASGQSAPIDNDDGDWEDRHFPLPKIMLGVNSPRRRPETAKCWTVVKRLKSSEDAPLWARKWFEKGKEFTHVCVYSIEEDLYGGTICNTPLRLHRFAKGANTKVSWVTTHATNHISRYHKSHVVADEVEKREKDLQTGRVSQMLGVKDEPPIKFGKPSVDSAGNSLKRFVLSRRQ